MAFEAVSHSGCTAYRSPGLPYVRDQQKAIFIEKDEVGATSVGVFLHLATPRLPLFNGRLVPLERSASGFLSTPAEAVPQELPHANQNVADGKLRLDQLGDALEGPQLGRVPRGPRASQQQQPEALVLDLSQPWWATWDRTSA